MVIDFIYIYSTLPLQVEFLPLFCKVSVGVRVVKVMMEEAVRCVSDTDSNREYILIPVDFTYLSLFSLSPFLLQLQGV